MKGISGAAFCFFALSLAPAPLTAVQQLVKITIEGQGLPAPVEISEPGIESFTVWAGPGTFINGGEQHEGFIIDWAKGPVDPPPSSNQRYLVSFYAGCGTGDWGCQTPTSSLAYVVVYEQDPATGQGLVYLPGRGDELFRFNHTMWHGHGLEGNWFHARPEWDSYVKPRISAATSQSAEPSP